MSTTFWLVQAAFDTLLIGGLVWALYEGGRLRKLAAQVRGSAHGTAALAEIVDDLEALTRASAVKANGEEIQRRLMLVDQKREELERGIDRAEELAASLHQPFTASVPVSAPVAPAAPAPKPRLAATAPTLLDATTPNYDLACDLLLGGLDAEDVARDTRLPIAEIEVLRALRVASAAPGQRLGAR